jgi:hypothetical protein
VPDSQYELDSEDRIRRFNQPWAEFARENGADHLVDAVVGTSIWDWVAGMEVEHLYRLLFARVRSTKERTRLPFRCDSPDVRRFMELHISPRPDGGLRCDARLQRAEPRSHVPVLDVRRPRSGAFLRICSWCRRVRVDAPERWLEIEQAMSALRLLEDPPPPITHTICDDCEALFDGSE